MTIPTEPIGSVLRPKSLRDAMQAAAAGQMSAVGTTDDCGFSPFGDDTSTSRDTAFTKIAARVEGTQMASRELGLQTSAAVSRTPNALRWSPAAGSRLRKEAFKRVRIGWRESS
jgi:hypothetical protein